MHFVHTHLSMIRIIDSELEYIEIFSKEGDAHFFTLLRV